jgi:hypothetical protein
MQSWVLGLLKWGEGGLARGHDWLTRTVCDIERGQLNTHLQPHPSLYYRPTTTQNKYSFPCVWLVI